MRKRSFLIGLVIVALVLVASVAPSLAASRHHDTVHVVQRGQTLSSIARYYGIDMWVLARANHIINPNHIYVGQRLIIPSVHPSPSGRYHVVRWGETMYSISRYYGVNVWELARVNGITNLNHIYVGQRLLIPGAAAPTPTPRPQPGRPANFPGPWTGEYFDNVSLSGGAYTVRTDEAINFNWTYGPPAGGMPTNSFSVRWTGTFDFPAGTYRFYAQVDDGVRVYVDGVRIINGWRDGALRLYTADYGLAAGHHTIQVEYYDRIQVARSYFWWRLVSGTTPTATPQPTAAPAPGGGWYGEYFNNTDMANDPVFTRHDPHIGFEWGTGSPASAIDSDFFSVRWRMTAHFNADHYQFCAMSDDGVRIWLGSTLVLDEWHPNNGIAFCNKHWVPAGNHEVKVEYYEEGGNALIYVWWEAD